MSTPVEKCMLAMEAKIKQLQAELERKNQALDEIFQNETYPSLARDTAEQAPKGK